jgi:hypothetical protein
MTPETLATAFGPAAAVAITMALLWVRSLDAAKAAHLTDLRAMLPALSESTAAHRETRASVEVMSERLEALEREERGHTSHEPSRGRR